jgi:predicted CoA-binding protein
MADDTDAATLRRILKHCRTIAVVGVSAEWHRPSYFVGKYLLEHGYAMVPVNPKYAQVLGQRCYPSVTAVAASGVPIDMVDCFRRAEDIGPLADEAIAAGARCLWMQLGVVNEGAAAKARAAGLDVVMDRCVKIEHGRLFGGLAWAGVNTRVISSRRPRQLPY